MTDSQLNEGRINWSVNGLIVKEFTFGKIGLKNAVTL